MSRKHQHISGDQLGRRQAAQDRRQSRERIWSIITLIILTALILLAVGIQISHHI